MRPGTIYRDIRNSKGRLLCKAYVEALIIAYGDGRNGKSTFWNAVSRVLGLYSGNNGLQRVEGKQG